MSNTTHAVIWVLICSGLQLFARESLDLEMITRIKQEGLKHSQVMKTLSYLTDVHGPRLSGSTNLRKAQEWSRDKLSEWGLKNARLESWGTFGRGWEVERFSAEMLTPQYLNLIAYPAAWTPGTDSLVTGKAVLIDYEDDSVMVDLKGQLAGKIVLLGKARAMDDHSIPDEARYDDDELKKLTEPDEFSSVKPVSERTLRWRRLRGKIDTINQFMIDEGARVVLRSSWDDHGTLRVMSAGSYNTSAPRVLPTLIIAKEHFNRIARLLEMDQPVELSVNVQANYLSKDSLGYNVLAEIPGVDRRIKNEVVMLGGHLDSWHSGTGATDNGAGSAVMMEAMRILSALGVQPRRTIRIGLWSAEEQGLLGSRGYVKKTLGDRRTMALKPAHDLFSAYFNLDNGSGKIRGVYLEENDAARPFFEAMFEPFHDIGATTVTIRKTASTDHVAFDEIGLPGFQFIQDSLAYFSRTWHTNMDVYDHVSESDLMQMSVIVASIVYHTAMRDEKIVRKPLPVVKKGFGGER